MIERSGFRLPVTPGRVGAVAAMVAAAWLVPVHMAEGLPTTRYAVVPAGMAATRSAAAIQPAIPPAPGPVIDTPFPLSHLAVRWAGSESGLVDIRLAGSAGTWGTWRRLHVNHDVHNEGGPVVSELIRAHGATRVQLRAAGDVREVEILAIDTMHGPRTRRVTAGAPVKAAEERAIDESPTDEEAADEGSAQESAPDEEASKGEATEKGTAETSPAGEDGDRSAGHASTASSTTTTTGGLEPAVGQPPIVTRAEWGADESIRKNKQKYAPISKLFVHHTVTSPDTDDPDPAATVRAIYAYHVQGNGWDDIGYNFLIDAQGRIYEGRWARDYRPGEKPTGEDLNNNGVIGAHVLNHNAGSAGVALIGDFTRGAPTAAAHESLVKLMAWEADRHDIDVTGQDPFLTSDGLVETFVNLAGHRDAGQTACPGDRLYPLLPQIREQVASMVTAARGPTTGYWTATADGGVLPFGDAQSWGSMAGETLNEAIVGMAATPSGKGYWLLGSDGGIFSFGDARFYGSTGAITLNKPIVGMAPTASGKGYWLLGSDGGIFSFGDARFYGSTGAITLNKPIVGMAPTPSGKGYWLVASDGGIFAFGDAGFHGSTGAMRLNKAVVSMAPNPDGKGYWLVASDGGLFAFDVPYFGSVPAAGPENYAGAVQMRATSSGRGYYIADAHGGIAVFGDARFLGADPSPRPTVATVDLVLGP